MNAKVALAAPRARMNVVEVDGVEERRTGGRQASILLPAIALSDVRSVNALWKAKVDAGRCCADDFRRQAALKCAPSSTPPTISLSGCSPQSALIASRLSFAESTAARREDKESEEQAHGSVLRGTGKANGEYAVHSPFMHRCTCIHTAMPSPSPPSPQGQPQSKAQLGACACPIERVQGTFSRKINGEARVCKDRRSLVTPSSSVVVVDDSKTYQRHVALPSADGRGSARTNSLDGTCALSDFVSRSTFLSPSPSVTRSFEVAKPSLKTTFRRLPPSFRRQSLDEEIGLRFGASSTVDPLEVAITQRRTTTTTSPIVSQSASFAHSFTSSSVFVPIPPQKDRTSERHLLSSSLLALRDANRPLSKRVSELTSRLQEATSRGQDSWESTEKRNQRSPLPGLRPALDVRQSANRPDLAPKKDNMIKSEGEGSSLRRGKLKSRDSTTTIHSVYASTDKSFVEFRPISKKASKGVRPSSADAWDDEDDDKGTRPKLGRKLKLGRQKNNAKPISDVLCDENSLAVRYSSSRSSMNTGSKEAWQTSLPAIPPIRVSEKDGLRDSAIAAAGTSSESSYSSVHDTQSSRAPAARRLMFAPEDFTCNKAPNVLVIPTQYPPANTCDGDAHRENEYEAIPLDISVSNEGSMSFIEAKCSGQRTTQDKPHSVDPSDEVKDSKGDVEFNVSQYHSDSYSSYLRARKLGLSHAQTHDSLPVSMSNDEDPPFTIARYGTLMPLQHSQPKRVSKNIRVQELRSAMQELEKALDEAEAEVDTPSYMRTKFRSPTNPTLSPNSETESLISSTPSTILTTQTISSVRSSSDASSFTVPFPSRASAQRVKRNSSPEQNVEMLAEAHVEPGSRCLSPSVCQPSIGIQLAESHEVDSSKEALMRSTADAVAGSSDGSKCSSANHPSSDEAEETITSRCENSASNESFIDTYQSNAQELASGRGRAFSFRKINADHSVNAPVLGDEEVMQSYSSDYLISEDEDEESTAFSIVSARKLDVSPLSASFSPRILSSLNSPAISPGRLAESGSQCIPATHHVTLDAAVCAPGYAEQSCSESRTERTSNKPSLGSLPLEESPKGSVTAVVEHHEVILDDLQPQNLFKGGVVLNLGLKVWQQDEGGKTAQPISTCTTSFTLSTSNVEKIVSSWVAFRRKSNESANSLGYLASLHALSAMPVEKRKSLDRRILEERQQEILSSLSNRSSKTRSLRSSFVFSDAKDDSVLPVADKNVAEDQDKKRKSPRELVLSTDSSVRSSRPLGLLEDLPSAKLSQLSVPMEEDEVPEEQLELSSHAPHHSVWRRRADVPHAVSSYQSRRRSSLTLAIPANGASKVVVPFSRASPSRLLHRRPENTNRSHSEAASAGEKPGG